MALSSVSPAGLTTSRFQVLPRKGFKIMAGSLIGLSLLGAVPQHVEAKGSAGGAISALLNEHERNKTAPKAAKKENEQKSEEKKLNKTLGLCLAGVSALILSLVGLESFLSRQKAKKNPQLENSKLSSSPSDETKKSDR